MSIFFLKQLKMFSFKFISNTKKIATTLPISSLESYFKMNHVIIPFSITRRFANSTLKKMNSLKKHYTTEDRQRIIKEMSLKRRILEEKRISAGEGNEGGISLSGIYISAFVVFLSGISYLSITEEGKNWFDKYVYKGTPYGKVSDWVKRKIGTQVETFTKPLSEHLLPDLPEMPPGMPHLRTLVLDFEDTLCHLQWDNKNGWRAIKRPGVDNFLKRVFSLGYEIVIFTSGNSFFLEPMIMSLDPFGYIQHRILPRRNSIYRW